MVVDKMHESLEEKFSRINFEIDYQPDLTKDEAIELLSSGQYVGLIVRSKIKITADVISHMKGIQFICRAGAGIDNLDVVELDKRKIHVINAPEGNRDAVAEHTMGMLLSLMHKIMVSDHEVRNFTWNREGNRGFELKGRTVGILGYGNMGTSLSERLHNFGCRVIAYDKSRVGFSNTYVDEVDFETFKKETEILSVHIPLDLENDKILDYSYLSSFQRLFILMNTSRGELLVLEDLIRLMDEGKIKGVALDVLENEKLQMLSENEKNVMDNLFNRKNVIFTPHVAGWTYESYERINQVLADKVSKLNLLEGSI